MLKVTERDLREQIRDACKLFGWLMYFSWSSLHSPRGFPDLVLVHPEKKRIIYSELKAEKGKLTPYQELWIEALRACDQEVYIWRPHDIDEIVGILS